MIDLKTSVVLPQKLWEKARNQEHLEQLILQYMKTSYPNYQIKRVENGFAICERRE